MTQELDLSKITGLTEAEAARRLRAEGYKELPSRKNRGLFSIALEIVREPMFGLLIGCGIIYRGKKKEGILRGAYKCL